MAKYITPKWFKIVIVLLIGLPVSWGTFNYINLSQLKRNKETSRIATQEVEKILQAELKKISLAISSLYALFEVADTIDRPTFNNFTQPFLRNLPGIRALEWTPKLSLEQRAGHEERVKAEGFENYFIKGLDWQTKTVVKSPSKSYYYPIHYIVPEKWNKITLGFDLSSNPIRVPSIQRSEKASTCIVSQPLQLIQNKPFERSFLVLQAVRQQDSIIGILQGVYNMNAFMDTILREQLSHLQIHIYDKTNQHISLYQSEAIDSLTIFNTNNLKGWSLPTTIQFCERKWEVYTYPRQHLTAYPHRPIAYAALAMGLMTTLIVIIIFLLNDNYARQLKQKVAISTQQLSEANHAQAILLKEIHHRVKNNLQVITGLLSLQANSIEDESTKELFKVSQYRISAMGMLHEQLYQSENLAHLSYGLYLEKLVQQLLHSIKGEEHHIQVDLKVPEEISLNLDTAIPLGLLINELITNSLKYGFPNNEGSIYIHLKKPPTTGKYWLLIGDNGVGFPKNQPHKTTSLGLQLVRQLVRQLNGQLEHLEEKAGTHYSIYFYESEDRN